MFWFLLLLILAIWIFGFKTTVNVFLITFISMILFLSIIVGAYS